jgi:hypothetical protein
MFFLNLCIVLERSFHLSKIACLIFHPEFLCYWIATQLAIIQAVSARPQLSAADR